MKEEQEKEKQEKVNASLELLKSLSERWNIDSNNCVHNWNPVYHLTFPQEKCNLCGRTRITKPR